MFSKLGPPLNPNKCTYLNVVAASSSPLPMASNDEDSPINRVSAVKDLGVLAFQQLIFPSAHSKAAHNTARRELFLI